MWLRLCFLVFPMPSRHNLVRLMGFAAALLVAAAAHAQTTSPGEGLLPVTQAFALKATIAKPGAVALHFDIAPHYYLYRGRIHAKILTPGVTAGALQTPAGTREHDPYLGDVEIYHDAVDASLPYSAAGAMPAMLKLEVEYQGCHEVAPKICYPPNTETFTLPLSESSGSARHVRSSRRRRSRTWPTSSSRTARGPRSRPARSRSTAG